MSKNLTRKGLAIGVVVALGTTLFAGAPALAAGNADNQVTLGAADGSTKYGTTLASTFKLAANNYDAVNIAGKTLKFLVTDASKQVKYNANADVASLATPVTVPTYEADGSFVVDSANGPSQTTDAGLALALPTTVTATTPVTVVAWVDANGNDVIDSTEHVSPTQTVTFYKTADISAVVVLNSPAVGDTYLKGKISSTTPVLNPTYTTNVDVQFYVHGSATAVAGTATWSSADSVWYTTTDSTVTTVAEGRSYGTEALIGTTVVGSRVNKSVVATTATTVDTEIVASADVNAAGDIRVGTSTAVIRATLTDENGKALPAGVPVKFTPTFSNGSLKINGVSTATTVEAYADTNASGVAEITATITGAVSATNTFAFAIAAQGVSGTTQTLTYRARQYKVIEVSDVNNSSYRALEAGGTYSLGVAVVDQWGNYLTSSTNTYGIKTVLTGRSASTTYTALSGGKATLSIVDGAITGQTDITVALDIVLKDGATWAAHGLTSPVVWSDSTPNGAADDKRVIAVYSPASYSVSATSSDKVQNVDADATATVDSRLDNKALKAYDDTNSRVTITGNTGIAGAAVTLSSTGLMFIATSGATVSKMDSITVFSGASGAYSVDVVSNKVVDAATVTVTSMGASATVKDIEFDPALAAKTFTISAPANSAAGRAIEVTATLADKYGNRPLATQYISFSSTGAGYLNATSATVDRNGKATVRIVFGVGETGSSTISATTTDTGILAANRTVKATVTIGAAPAATVATSANASASTGKINVAVTAAAGKTVVVKVGGKFATSFSATGAKKTVAVKSAKGAKTVTIYVGGKLVKTVKVTVK